MVNFLLEITAELENLTNLQPQGGVTDPDLPYHFKLKCGNCGEITQKETYVMLSETVPLPIGKGTTHLIQKSTHIEELKQNLKWANREVLEKTLKQHR